MKALIGVPLGFLRLVWRSVCLAVGQIWSNKTRSFLTTVGIVIGVGSVTAVIGALTGLKAKVLEDFESFGTNTIWISPHRPQEGPKSNAPRWIIRFDPKHFEDIREHCPSLGYFTLVSWGGRQTVRADEITVDSVRVYGVQSQWHKIENRKILLGRPVNEIDDSRARNVCLVEPKLRDELRLDRDCIGDMIMIGRRSYMIVGVVESQPQRGLLEGMAGGGADYEIFIPFGTNQKLHRNPWTWAIASSRSTELTEEASAELRFFLRRTRQLTPGEPDTFRIESIQSHIQKFKEIAVMITLVAGGVVGISLLVGGVGIMNIMLVSVSERTREIGLRKAVGARKSAVLTQFLVEAVVLCLMGGVFGVGLGHLLTGVISRINPVLEKTEIPFWAVLTAFGFSSAVGLIFGMFPAIKAARLDPIEALRHE